MNAPEKMKFETSNLTAENVTKAAELFPCVVVEREIILKVMHSMLGEKETL